MSYAEELTRPWDVDMIDKNTHEIRQDEDKVVYKSLEEVGDDLPDHSPRYILLSYPLTMVSSSAGPCDLEWT